MGQSMRNIIGQAVLSMMEQEEDGLFGDAVSENPLVLACKALFTGLGYQLVTAFNSVQIVKLLTNGNLWR